MKWYFFILWLALSQSSKGQNTFPSSDNNRLIHFIPTSFSNKFSLNIPPVLTIKPGDTVRTETIDAAGFDRNAVKRQRGGNPLTGPFYIENSNSR